MQVDAKPMGWKAHWPEYTTEIVIALVSLGLFAFVKLAGGVSAGRTRGFDAHLLLMFRNPEDLSDPLGPPWMEVFVRDLTALGGFGTLTLLTVAACGYLWLRRKPGLALSLALSVGGGLILNTVLKGFIGRPRPDIVPHGTSAALASFPSGHAMMAAVVYLTLGAMLAYFSERIRFKVYFLFWSVLLTVLVGISRLYLGVHWPTDIIAGWIAGAAWALVCLLVTSKVLGDGARIGVEDTI
jgi:undecaprenyl-diphosphatase